MSRVNSEDARVVGAISTKSKKVCVTQLLAGNLVLTDEFPDLMNFSAAAARNIDLPAATAANDGREFTIYNSSAGAFSFTVRLTGGGATVATIAQNKGATFYNANGTWIALASA